MGKNEFIRQIIGQEYLYKTTGIEEETPLVHDAFREIAEINRQLFELIPYDVVFTYKDMYSSASEMRSRVMEENTIYIYTGWSGHPFLSQEENNIGRAVHDVLAHMVCGCPFTFEGEFTAYLEQKKYYPEWVHEVLFAEIPAQTAAYYANGNSHEFSQRAIMAPSHWIELSKNIELENYSKNSVLAPFEFAYKNRKVV